MLILTNGDLAAKKIRLFKPEVTVLPWRDVLHEGPVLHYDDPEACSFVRTQFIAEFAHLSLEQIRSDFQKRDQCLKEAALSDMAVELWFEHDLYDQLQILQILAYVKCWNSEKTLFLVQADNYLTDHTSQELREIAQEKIRVSSLQKMYAWRLWKAFCTGNLPGLIDKDKHRIHVLLPWMSEAMCRLLKEYPDVKTGLSLSLRNALTILLKEKALTVKVLFQVMQDKESAKFMGDLGFAYQIFRLLSEEQPILKTYIDTPLVEWQSINVTDFFQTVVSLTDLGAKILLGQEQRSDGYKLNYWIGGTDLSKM